MHTRCRVRDLGIRVGAGQPGRFNAITDVRGVRVGHSTIVDGEGPLQVGEGPVRTGVTVILPHRNSTFVRKTRAAVFVANGTAEVAGRTLVEELGYIETPIAITNTLSVPTVSDALVDHTARLSPDMGISEDTVVPLVLECDDGWLNDIRGRHVRKENVFEAIATASSQVIEEGAVGAGTGLICFGFKGGIGTSSREVVIAGKSVTIGVLVAANMGRRSQLMVCGVPVGEAIVDYRPILRNVWKRTEDAGSIVMVVATDAPLSERQLRRIAVRAPFGVARTGAICMHGSGDIVVAFTTANQVRPTHQGELIYLRTLSDEDLDDLFLAVVEATEEAILNSLTMATTTTGRDGNCAFGLPLDQLQILTSHSRRCR